MLVFGILKAKIIHGLYKKFGIKNAKKLHFKCHFLMNMTHVIFWYMEDYSKK